MNRIGMGKEIEPNTTIPCILYILSRARNQNQIRTGCRLALLRAATGTGALPASVALRRGTNACVRIGQAS